MSMILYQNRFYTDTVGLSPSSLGSMFLLLRLGDAVIDPVIGALSDRTKPAGASSAPGFCCTAHSLRPDFLAGLRDAQFWAHGKLVYAFVTYILVHDCSIPRTTRPIRP